MSIANHFFVFWYFDIFLWNSKAIIRLRFTIYEPWYVHLHTNNFSNYYAEGVCIDVDLSDWYYAANEWGGDFRP